MFRILGLLPIATVGIHLAGAVAGVSLSQARDTVAELVRAHLVTEVGGERFRLHDLVHLYAAELAAVEELLAQRAAVADRYMDWYLAVADEANRSLGSGRDRVVPRIQYRPETLPVALTREPEAALAYLDLERANLLPTVAFAAGRADPTAAWQLTYLLTGYFDARGHWPDRIAMCDIAATAAARAGDGAAEGLMRSGLGVALIMANRFADALRELQQALVLMRAVEDRRGEAHVENNLAAAHAGLRRFETAIDAFHRALALHTARGHDLGVALALNNIGDAYVRVGRPELGAEYLSRALAMSRDLRNGWLEGAALSGLGQSALNRGDLDAAVRHFREAIEVRRATGDRRHEAETLHHLGLTHLRRGEHPAALDQLRRALARSQDTANPHLEALILHSLGRAYRAAGDSAEAAGYLGLALALRMRVPDDEHAALIRADLAETASGPKDAAV
jgi:tetratricopeptide (TPR) repeat protein